jgi:hypothetical protein
MRNAVVPVGAVVLGALILLWPAVYNGCPLIYTDTGTYMESAFTLHVPADRPIGYSLFIRLAGAGRSLWPVVFCQSLILAFLLQRLWGRVAARCGIRGFVLSCALLAALTGLPWVMGTVFADAFTPSCLLSLLLLLLPGGCVAETAACAAIFVLANSTHATHLLVSTLILAALGGVRLASRAFPVAGAGRYGLAVLLLAVSWLSVPALNASMGGGFYITRAGNVIVMARIWENGILKRFLDEHCAEKEYALCEYRGEVHGHSGYFLWNPQSPLYRTGGWQAPHDEYGRIIRESLADYPLDWARESARSTLLQLGSFNAGSAIAPLSTRTWAYRVMERRFPEEFPRFLSSRQQRGALHLRFFLLVQYAAVLVSLCLIAGRMIIRRPAVDRLFRFILCFTIFAIVANAAVCASISVVDDRYSARVMWLFPLCCLLMFVVGWLDYGAGEDSGRAHRR